MYCNVYNKVSLICKVYNNYSLWLQVISRKEQKALDYHIGENGTQLLAFKRSRNKNYKKYKTTSCTYISFVTASCKVCSLFTIRKDTIENVSYINKIHWHMEVSELLNFYSHPKLGHLPQVEWPKKQVWC